MKQLLLLTLLYMFTCSCRKNCPAYKTEYFPDKGFILGYAGNEKLKFLKNGRDTVTFAAGGWIESNRDLTDQNCDGCCTKDKLLARTRYFQCPEVIEGENYFRIDESVLKDTSINIRVTFYYGRVMHAFSISQAALSQHSDSYTLLGRNYSNISRVTTMGDIALFNLQNGLIRFEAINYQGGTDVFELVP